MKRLSILLLLLLIFISPSSSLAKNDHPEKWYQQKWCSEHKGEAEVILPDKTRADCITSTHAVEFDFGTKWAEAIRQALYYGLQTGKKPGVVLIMEEEKDYKYWLRLNSTIEHYRLPIETWKLER